ncbi:MAG TPA: thiamine-phosphate kinase [Rhodanobacteraceae bacterium]
MEFDLIELINAATALPRDDVVLGIGDDTALLRVPAGQELAVAIDTLVDGVHFPRGTAPEDIGWKSLAVNLSDLAAMGATPAWATLALTLPHSDRDFVGAFVTGFAALAKPHRVALVGGDTTQGPLAVSVGIHGFVPAGQALRRAGARVGDDIYVTGTLGDAMGALRGLAAGGTPAALRARLDRPTPRVEAGLALRGLASACVDVSDGLLADLGHICRASGVGAMVEADAVPVSDALRAHFDAATVRGLALTGGDNYELCFTAPATRGETLMRLLSVLPGGVTRIGRIVAGSDVRAHDRAGLDITPRTRGWEHFSA